MQDAFKKHPKRYSSSGTPEALWGAVGKMWHKEGTTGKRRKGVLESTSSSSVQVFHSLCKHLSLQEGAKHSVAEIRWGCSSGKVGTHVAAIISISCKILLKTGNATQICTRLLAHACTFHARTHPPTYTWNSYWSRYPRCTPVEVDPAPKAGDVMHQCPQRGKGVRHLCELPALLVL